MTPDEALDLMREARDPDVRYGRLPSLDLDDDLDDDDLDDDDLDDDDLDDAM